MDLIYHYTTEKHLEKILETGFLKVSEWEKKNKVKPPSLWLSLNPVWENTATKMINTINGIKQMTIQEQFENFGMIRFVIVFEKQKLCSWQRYKYASNTRSDMYLQMEKSGIKQNANPLEWYASFKNIPLEQCLRCEKWNGNEWELLFDCQTLKN